MNPDLQARLRNVASSGIVDPALVRDLQLAALDPAAADELAATLRAMLGDQAEPLLDIAAYYDEKDGRPFELRWPLSPFNAIITRSIAFGDLDRRTQFFVLFAEWQNREAEGTATLLQGDTAAARAIFVECVERSEQLDVAELRARSYAGMARWCGHIGDQRGAQEWAQKAAAVRQP